MSDPDPIRVRLTADQRKFLVRVLHDIISDAMMYRRPESDVDEMLEVGPSTVRYRDMHDFDAEDAIEVLDKIDYDGSESDYVAWLRYLVDGPAVPPMQPPGPIPMGPVPS
jgi:hypothetical protein